MANLLPNEIKQKFRQTILVRKLEVAGLAFGLLVLIAVVIMFAFWASLFIRKHGLLSLSQSLAKEVQEDLTASPNRVLLKKIDRQTKILDNYWRETLVSELFTKALNLKPAGIKITGLAIERGDIGKPVKLSITGFAEGRTVLVNYVNLLRQDKFFTRVDLPVESLLSDTGGQFIINLEK